MTDEQVEVIEDDQFDELDDEEEYETDTDNDCQSATDEEWQSDAKETFRDHSSSVICCEFRPPDCKFVISGGQDDRAFVWNLNDLTVAIECKGHGETVACVSCSHDGKYIATGDMNGLVQVWDFGSKDKIWNTETSSEIIWLQWHPCSHVLLSGTSTGDVWLWALPSGNCKIFPTHGSRTDCGKFLPDGLRAIVGYDDGSVKTLNLKKSSTGYHFRGGNKHGGPVCCIDCYRGNVVCASGSQQDCTVKLLDTRSNKVLNTLQCDKISKNEENGVESLAFHSSHPTLVTGSLKGTIKVWDVATHTEKASFVNPAGIVKLLWHPESFLVYVGGLDGFVRRWDTRNGKLDGEWRGHSTEILDMALNFAGTRLVTASDDSTCCVFDTS